MGILNHWYLILILVVVLIIFGPGKLPQIGGAIGTAIKEFRKATTEIRDDITRATEHPPEGPTTGADYPQPAASAPVATEPKPEAGAVAPAEPKKEAAEAPKA
jgi:sec-independent protein translocase protein TatA